ncbi:hypothetical protein FA95DRAFT_1098577 [Auriscalpium vulgare]|uniref:Uncharacterized protein n=1 Tax=Auriscalpium vulgare TaxID=40419 RepID=A0ACB8RXM5_9AGAM|nr:hypothetical protein FA95DRAFT_1098577 [Auriscalpium vulgare]
MLRGYIPQTCGFVLWQFLTALHTTIFMRTKCANFPALIIRAQAALLRAPTSGAQAWSFDPFDVEIGSPVEVKFDGSLLPDTWWWDEWVNVSNRSAQLNVSMEDIRNAYKYPDISTTSVDIQYQYMPTPTSAPISPEPSRTAPSPLLLASYSSASRNVDTGPHISHASHAAPISPPERKRVHKGGDDDDAGNSTHVPSSTKRPKGRPRKSETWTASEISFVHRRLDVDDDESELPPDAIVVRIDPSRYLVGLSSSPRNIAQCVGCYAAGNAPCFKGPITVCTLCSLRKRPCKPLQQPALASLAEPLQETLPP